MDEIDHMIRACRERLDQLEMDYKKYGLETVGAFGDFERSAERLTAVYTRKYIEFYGRKPPP